MANKRDLKKQIKFICGDIACECIIARNFIPGVDVEKMNQNIFDVAILQTSTLKRVSFVYDKVASDFADKKQYLKAKRQYFAEAYKKLNSDFSDAINSIVKSMNDALTKEQKEANKKALEA